MTGRSVLTAIAAALGTILFVGGVVLREPIQIAVGVAGIGLAGVMFKWGQPPPT